MEADQPRLTLRFDQEKAALRGIGADQVAQVVRIAEAGDEAGLLHAPQEPEDVPIRLRLSLAQRANPSEMQSIPLCAESAPIGDASDGSCVPLGEVTRIVRDVGEKSIYRKNMLPVVYVTGDVAGAQESPVYALLQLNKNLVP